MSDFKAKVHQIRFPLGLRPRPRWGSLQRSPDLLAVFKGPTSKEKEGVKKWGREEEEREERGRDLPDQCKTASYVPVVLFRLFNAKTTRQLVNRNADFLRKRIDSNRFA